MKKNMQSVLVPWKTSQAAASGYTTGKLCVVSASEHFRCDERTESKNLYP